MLRNRAQTSIEFLLLISGAVLLALVIGYYVISSAIHLYKETNAVANQ